jgi:hypothetical protein
MKGPKRLSVIFKIANRSNNRKPLRYGTTCSVILDSALASCVEIKTDAVGDTMCVGALSPRERVETLRWDPKGRELGQATQTSLVLGQGGDGHVSVTSSPRSLVSNAFLNSSLCTALGLMIPQILRVVEIPFALS